MSEPNRDRLGSLLSEMRRASMLGDERGRVALDLLLRELFSRNEFYLGREAADDAAGELTGLLQQVDSLGPDAWWFAEHVRGFKACNWRLQEVIEEFLHAVGDGRPLSPAPPAGHERSLTEARWLRIWSYYLYLRRWLLPQDRLASIPLSLVAHGDPSGELGEHINASLGERDELKMLYVRRFCLCLEMWLFRLRKTDGTLLTWHRLAEEELERSIYEANPGDTILREMLHFGEYGVCYLPPCHYMVFQRYDHLLACIGAGQWDQAACPDVDANRERGELLAAYLDRIRNWLAGSPARTEFGRRFREMLGRPHPVKRFWVAVLYHWYHPARVIALQGGPPR